MKITNEQMKSKKQEYTVLNESILGCAPILPLLDAMKECGTEKEDKVVHLLKEMLNLYSVSNLTLIALGNEEA